MENDREERFKAEAAKMSSRELLRNMESHIGACDLPECVACARIVSEVEEIATRLGIPEYRSKFRNRSY